MKYTIDLTEKEATVLRNIIATIGENILGEDNLFRGKNIKQDIPLPLKESPAYKQGFEAGKEHHRKYPDSKLAEHYDNGYKRALDDLMEVYNCENLEVFMNDTFKCVMDYNFMIRKYKPIEVIKKFKKWQKEKNFKVGDEVRFNGATMVITDIDDTYICTINSRGHVDTWKKTASLIRTGRHFDEVQELLDEIGGSCD